MPRKKLTRWRVGDPQVSPTLVRQGLSAFHELAQLRTDQIGQLAEDLAHAVNFASLGFPAVRGDASGLREVRLVFIADVVRAMRKQGLPVTTYRFYVDGGQPQREALVFMIARQIAALARLQQADGSTVYLRIPYDPFRLLKRSQQLIYSS
jgi:hypothetical protein